MKGRETTSSREAEGGADEGRGLARLLAGIPGGPLRRHAALRALAALEPAECVRALDELIQGAATRRPEALEALADVSAAIGDDAGALRRNEIVYEARALDAPLVEALFCDLGPRDDSVGRAAKDGLGDLTLGHRIALARGRDAMVLQKLAERAEPAVVNVLLANPRVTETLVVRMAARRPIPPQSLLAIARSPRFGASRAVRRALVRNPHLPVGEALRIAPLLLGTDLLEIARDPAADPRLRDEARALLSRRP